MKRRTFLILPAGAAASAVARPRAAWAQQSMPVVGLLGVAPASPLRLILRQALAEAGFHEGRNVAIESRWAEGEYDRLPAMAAELVRRRVAVLVAMTTPPALAAKAATGTIPIVFAVADDPVRLGLVTGLARPEGNATGVSFLLGDLGAKQLGLLRELVPTARRIGMLVNPDNPNAESVAGEVRTAAASLGVEIALVRASDSRSIEAAFATMVHDKTDALLVGTDPFFFSRRLQLATLAIRHAIPAVYNVREYAQAGGLMSYGTSLTETYRQVGLYVGRLLKGAKPADLPVVQSVRFDFVINMITARALGIEVPPMLLARADEVIE